MSDVGPSLGISAKAIVVWVAILGMAIANGAVREAILIPRLGRGPGLVLSGLMLSGLIVGITTLALRWIGAPRRSHLLAIGAGWLVLTLMFEFAFGRYQGKSWEAILEAYTFRDGNLWPVVLLVTLLAPYVVGRWRGVP